jgi:hypothetical protein
MYAVDGVKENDALTLVRGVTSAVLVYTRVVRRTERRSLGDAPARGARLSPAGGGASA